MRVVRDRHPLKGCSLEVLGQMHCRGRLELLLVLPDGSKSLIPAAWTDFPEGKQEAAAAGGDSFGQLAAVGQLLEAYGLVSSLLSG
ncbi:DUF5372 family protein [Streptomyces sp. CA-106131]|uniref:DUF5372 family protein n=1 Tax=Streptomyces sp. CA-106131 TaxID=3240045 RepID=UPI003D8BA28D